MKDKINALKAAFLVTIPVLTGFTILGIGFGILMGSKGFGLGWSVLMSLTVYAGSAQFAAVTFLTSVFNPLNALLLTIMINARHFFYGISMLNIFKKTGRMKPFLIFALSDETFSILCSEEPPKGIDKKRYMFFISLLDYCYWVFGTALGALIGYWIAAIKGLEFVLIAHFTVIFVEQWKGAANRIPAIIGLIGTLVCFLIFGREGFIIPSMLLIVIALTLLKNNCEKGEKA